MIAALAAELRRHDRLAIAFSGGTDSTLLAEAARRLLGAERVLLLHARSVFLPGSDRLFAESWAESAGLRLIPVDFEPLAEPAVRANDELRCYHCKKIIFSRLLEVARQNGFVQLADGANLDDQGDYRPGMRAAAELEVVHPLLAAGMTKAMIRRLAGEYGLPNAEQPASACLASRVPTGTALDAAVLMRIDRAEMALRELGFGQLRVRAFGELAKLELPAADFATVLARRDAVLRVVREAGFREVTLDLAGYRTGAMNRPIGN